MPALLKLSICILLAYAVRANAAELKVHVRNAFTGKSEPNIDFKISSSRGDEFIQSDTNGVMTIKHLRREQVYLVVRDWFETLHVGRIGPLYGGFKIDIPTAKAFVEQEVFVAPKTRFRGRVVNSLGQVVPKAGIVPLSKRDDRGFAWERGGGVLTDARGEFEFSEESSNLYTLYVVAPEAKPKIHNQMIGSGDWTDALYFASGKASSPSAIAGVGGKVNSGLDFVVGETKTVPVSLRFKCDYVLDRLRVAAGSTLVAGLNEKMVNLNGGLALDLELPSGGEYWIQAVGVARDINGTVISVSGDAVIVAGTSPSTAKEISLHPDTVVYGEISLDESVPRLHELWDSVRIKFKRTLGMYRIFGDLEMPVQPDGSFSTKPLGRSIYTVELDGLPPGLFVKSIIWKGMDVLRKPFALDGAGIVKIVLSKGFDVSALVRDRRGKPMAGAAVALLPDVDRHTKEEWMRLGSADEKGEFVIQGVPPGRYVACALVSAKPEALLNLGYRKKVCEGGVRVELPRQDNLRLDLKVKLEPIFEP